MTSTCLACGGTEQVRSDIIVGDEIPLFHCRGCGLGALAVGVANEGEFDDYWGEINQRIYADPHVIAELGAKYERYFRGVDTLVPNRRFLDVGSGAGVSIGTAERMGFEPTGIEPSPKAVALSRRQFDIPVTCGLLSSDDNLPRDFGMLALWDVIEHVCDPEALIRACHQHLAPGGLLLIETPDEGALLRRLISAVGGLGVSSVDFRGSIYYRAHRYYFTRAAMTSLLSRCGFSGVRYFAEHTMFQKELRKKRLYEGLSAAKETALKVTFAMLEHIPLLANKMVVIAVKAPGSN